MQLWGKIYLTLLNLHAKCEPRERESGPGMFKLYSTVSLLYIFVSDKKSFGWLKADTQTWLETPLWTNGWVYRAPKGNFLLLHVFPFNCYL